MGLAAVPWPATAESAMLVVNGSPAVQAALRVGNLEQIRRLSHDHKIGPGSTALFNAQLQYKLPRLLRLARKYEDKLALSKPDGWMADALYCNQFARAAALTLGDAHAFLAEAKFAQEALAPAFSVRQRRPVKFGNGLDHVNLRELVKSTPVLTADWQGNEGTLAVVPTADSSGLAAALEVHVTIDGVDTLAEVRPSSGLRAPVTIIARKSEISAVYKKLGLKPLVDPFGHVAITGTRSADANVVSLALARTVNFGPLTLRNVGVSVVQSGGIPPGVYVGMSLLAKFGAVAISSRDVVLSRQALSGCADAVPMTFAAGWDQHGNLQFPATLKQKAVTAIWDPEVRVALGVDSDLFAAATGTQANGFAAKGNLPYVPILLRVGEQMLHPESVDALSAGNTSHQVEIGSASLVNHVVYLTFGGKQPTIAFCQDTKGLAHAQKPVHQ